MKQIRSTLLVATLLLGGLVYSARAYDTADFADVAKTNWAYNSVMKMADAGIIKGTSGSFNPEVKVSGAMFLTLVGRVVYESDVQAATTAEDNWYSAYVRVAQDKGLLTGTSITDATAAGEMTRYDMAVIVSGTLELLGVAEVPLDSAGITDYGDIPNKYTTAVERVYAHGIIKGDGAGNFSGTNTMRRDEASAVMERLLTVVDGESRKEDIPSVNEGKPGNGIREKLVPPEPAPPIEMPEVGEYTAEYQAYLDNCGEDIVTRPISFKMVDNVTKTPLPHVEMAVERHDWTGVEAPLVVTKIKSDANGRGTFELKMPKSLYEKTMVGADGTPLCDQFTVLSINSGSVNTAGKVDATVNGVNYRVTSASLTHFYVRANNPCELTLTFFKSSK